MEYLNSDRHRNLRQKPTNLTPWARTIVVLGWPYALNRSSGEEQCGQIAGYVGSEDYHLMIPNVVRPLLDELPKLCGSPVQAQVFCDSAPILERELGVRAGLGWIGKNSCLINPVVGSAFLLAEVFLDIQIAPDPPHIHDRCGNCHLCIDACPVGCILPDRTIDANRCISALTIEEKRVIPRDAIKAIGNRVFGCDVCQSVCPWNRIKGSGNQSKSLSLSFTEMDDLLTINEIEFNERFAMSALMRSKRRGLIRNIIMVIENLGYSPSQSNLGQLLEHDPDPVIRISAAGALLTIDPMIGHEYIALQLSRERDVSVQKDLMDLISK